MAHWLRCTLSRGQFPDEFVVQGETTDGKGFSLFAEAEDVEADTALPEKRGVKTPGWIRVDLCDERDGETTARGSRTGLFHHGAGEQCVVTEGSSDARIDMILGNTEIFAALDSGRLVIDPEPQPRPSGQNGDSPYDTHSVDLRLGPNIVIPRSGPFTYDLTQPGQLADLIERNSEHLTISSDQPFRLEPRRFISRPHAGTRGIADPARPTAAFLPFRQDRRQESRARVGLLVHFTAPTVHPGFTGTLTLEMINLGPVPISLVPEMPIAQPIIEEVKGLPIENPSQFQGQTTPAGTAQPTS